MGCPGPFTVGSDFSGLGEDRRLGGGLLLGNRLLAALGGALVVHLVVLAVDRPEPAGISLPMMTFSFRPSRWSTLP